LTKKIPPKPIFYRVLIDIRVRFDTEMMQSWAGYLDGLKAETLNKNVIMAKFGATV